MKPGTIVQVFDMLVLYRRTSRAVEFKSYRGVTQNELNEILSDSLLIRIESLRERKEVVTVEGKRIPV